jgi:hypothetical protein
VCFNNIINGGIEKVRSDVFQGEQRHSGAKKPSPAAPGAWRRKSQKSCRASHRSEAGARPRFFSTPLLFELVRRLLAREITELDKQPSPPLARPGREEGKLEGTAARYREEAVPSCPAICFVFCSLAAAACTYVYPWEKCGP